MERLHLVALRLAMPSHLIRRATFVLVCVFLFGLPKLSSPLLANPALLQERCATCHDGDEAAGSFPLTALGKHPTRKNLARWLDSLDRVRALEMPPADADSLAPDERKRIISYLQNQLTEFSKQQQATQRIRPRRLNNREFRNSIRDALMLEDIGTHQPTDDLIGDSLHDGFDTHGETLGFSEFHLEQYIKAVRSIVDGIVFADARPTSRRLEIAPTEIFAAHTSQNTNRPERRGRAEGFDFLDPQQLAYFRGFKTVPHTGLYRITIRCTGKDRGVYPAEKTGIFDGDPIRLRVRMGDRQREFELPDEKIEEIEFTEWLTAGSRLRLQYPTDGLRMRGNGNFKFQNAIAGEFIKEHAPERYAKIVAAIKTKPGRRARPPQSWHHWVDYWRGPRPRIRSVVVEGPFFTAWPPQQQVALLGQNPTAQRAQQILEPIAARAWRRPVRSGELDKIVALVQAKARQLGPINALKEGIVAILVSPEFLLLNQERLTDEERFASKVSYFLTSTIPDQSLRDAANAGKLDSYPQVLATVRAYIQSNRAEAFLRAFPHGWLQLNDINFMAPDPDKYAYYHRKRVSEDMVAEVLQFFRHAAQNDVPVPELLSANYSFINADLAKIYGVSNVPQDSVLRKHTFADGRRGGLLGMGAFLTVTADSLSTSPIHRATYVMENLLGIHPTPPPADVEVSEPDVRQAKTIKEILNKHRTEANCAECHRRIDPFGYAFENFDPTGAWRDVYTVEKMVDGKATRATRRSAVTQIPIDASAKFRDGTKYKDIVQYRQRLLSAPNRDRFMRCFITKLLTYANGAEPGIENFAEIDRILAVSAEHEYRMIETIAAVIDSPLFREK